MLNRRAFLPMLIAGVVALGVLVVPVIADELFGELSTGGAVLMPLDDYGFSPRFGWCTDRYGVSWQIGST